MLWNTRVTVSSLSMTWLTQGHSHPGPWMTRERPACVQGLDRPAPQGVQIEKLTSCDWTRRLQVFLPKGSYRWGFPSGSNGKEPACNAGDLGSILEWGKSPGKGHDNPLQYSCLENPMDRGTWQATIRAPAACSFPGENARSWEALGDPRHAGFPRGEHRGSRHRFL